MSTFILISLTIGLAVAVTADLLQKRIPNLVVLSLVLLGFFGNIFGDHSYGIWSATAGLMTGLLCFLPFHIFGAMGAGDVKLLAAIGSVIGPEMVLLTALMTIAAGGFIALAYITLRGGLLDIIRRYRRMFLHLLYKYPVYIPPAPGEAAGLRFPYALAIAAGTFLAMLSQF